MAGSTNFQQWNPAQANQESDAAYAADPQRTGGASNDSAFPSPTGNKLFYQVSTGITALMEMMATKGFTVNDTNIATLASVLSALLTTADIRPGLVALSYASVINCNVSQALGFEISLSGNATITTSGAQIGDIVTFVFAQDSAGGHGITWPSYFEGAAQPDTEANGRSSQIFKVVVGGGFLAIGPSMNQNGICSTPIGTPVAASGAFTDLTAATGNIVGLTSATGDISTLVSNSGAFNILTATTPASADNSTNAATTAWARLGFSVSLASNGYIKFPAWLGGWTVQWCQGASLSNETPQTTNFPTDFATACLIALVNPLASGTDYGEQISFATLGWTASGVTYYYERNADHSGMTVSPLILAIGY
jgi:hypothetical protein